MHSWISLEPPLFWTVHHAQVHSPRPLNPPCPPPCAPRAWPKPIPPLYVYSTKCWCLHWPAIFNWDLLNQYISKLLFCVFCSLQRKKTKRIISTTWSTPAVRASCWASLAPSARLARMAAIAFLRWDVVGDCCKLFQQILFQTNVHIREQNKIMKLLNLRLTYNFSVCPLVQSSSPPVVERWSSLWPDHAFSILKQERDDYKH